MLDFCREIIYSKLRRLQGIFHKVMLKPFSFTNVLVPKTNKENIVEIIGYLFHYYGLLFPQIIIHQRRKNSRHYMLSHTVISK